MATDVVPEATRTEPGEAAGRSGIRPYRLTVGQFKKMIDAGIFRDRDRIELLGGILFKKMTQDEPHAFGVDELRHRIADMLPREWTDRQEKPIVLGRFRSRSRTSSWREGPGRTTGAGTRGPPTSA